MCVCVGGGGGRGCTPVLSRREHLLSQLFKVLSKVHLAVEASIPFTELCKGLYDIIMQCRSSTCIIIYGHETVHFHNDLTNTEPIC